MTKTWFSILFLVSLACGSASADTITITLDSPTLSGSAGDVLLFDGILTNTGTDTVFLNTDNLNLAGFPLSSLDGSPFFNEPVSLGGGGGTSDMELFDITIPDPFTPGSYDGTFQVLGGVDGSAQDILGTADFAVQVLGPTSGVPEPRSVVLLGAAFLGLCWFRRWLGPSGVARTMR
jgi:hypothetical protein